MTRPPSRGRLSGPQTKVGHSAGTRVPLATKRGLKHLTGVTLEFPGTPHPQKKNISTPQHKALSELRSLIDKARRDSPLSYLKPPLRPLKHTPF